MDKGKGNITPSFLKVEIGCIINVFVSLPSRNYRLRLHLLRARIFFFRPSK